MLTSACIAVDIRAGIAVSRDQTVDVWSTVIHRGTTISTAGTATMQKMKKAVTARATDGLTFVWPISTFAISSRVAPPGGRTLESDIRI